MFRAMLPTCALLIASVVAMAAEELPVRDPMRPYGRDAGAAVGTAAATNGPRFALTGVVLSSARRVAILNGKPYQQGESVDGAEIVAIESHAVRLSDRGTQLVIPLGRPGYGRQPITQGEIAP